MHRPLQPNLVHGGREGGMEGEGEGRRERVSEGVRERRAAATFSD